MNSTAPIHINSSLVAICTGDPVHTYFRFVNGQTAVQNRPVLEPPILTPQAGRVHFEGLLLEFEAVSPGSSKVKFTALSQDLQGASVQQGHRDLQSIARVFLQDVQTGDFGLAQLGVNFVTLIPMQNPPQTILGFLRGRLPEDMELQEIKISHPVRQGVTLNLQLTAGGVTPASGQGVVPGIVYSANYHYEVALAERSPLQIFEGVEGLYEQFRTSFLEQPRMA